MVSWQHSSLWGIVSSILLPSWYTSRSLSSTLTKSRLSLCDSWCPVWLCDLIDNLFMANLTLSVKSLVPYCSASKWKSLAQIEYDTEFGNACITRKFKEIPNSFHCRFIVQLLKLNFRIMSRSIHSHEQLLPCHLRMTMMLHLFDSSSEKSRRWRQKTLRWRSGDRESHQSSDLVPKRYLIVDPRVNYWTKIRHLRSWGTVILNRPIKLSLLLPIAALLMLFLTIRIDRPLLLSIFGLVYSIDFPSECRVT